MEQLLQKSATDIDTAGYDPESGGGRLNVRALLDSIKKDDYQIIHPVENYVSYTIELEDTIRLLGRHLQDYGPYGNEDITVLNEFPDFTYDIERYKITATYNFTNYLTVPSTQFLDVWPRKNTSTFVVNITGVDFTSPGENYEKFKIIHDVELVSSTLNTVTFSGYIYHFIKEFDDNTLNSNMDAWYPSDTTNFRFDYSLYLRDTIQNLNFDFPCDSINYMIDSAATVLENINHINIYPNPSNEYFYVNSSSSIDNITITDLSGKVILKQENTTAVKTQKINSSSMAMGIYFVTVTTVNDNYYTQKIIIQ
jgi:hypothetical protein